MCFFVWNVWFGEVMCSNMSNGSNGLRKRIEFKLQHSAGNRTAHSGSRGKLVLDQGMWTKLPQQQQGFFSEKWTALKALAKVPLVLWSCMAASHRPSAAFSFLSKCANRRSKCCLGSYIFSVPIEASSNPLLGRSESCKARFQSNLWQNCGLPFTTP